MKKRIVSLLLVLCLALTLLPTAALAADPGDLNGDGKTNTDDAVYLLLHVMFGAEDYPVSSGADLNFNGQGKVNTDDAVYLLLHVMFGAEDYPLYPEESTTKPTTPEEIALAEAEIRRALGLLIDRNAIVRITGAGEVPANTLVGDGALDVDGESFVANANGGKGYYSTDPADYEANRQEAIGILKKYYTFDGTKFTDFPTLHYIYNTNDGHKAIAEYIQSTLAKLGITMTPEAQEWGTFLTVRSSGDFELARNGWIADTSNPITFLGMYATDNYNNDVQLGKGDHGRLAIYDLDLTPYGYNIKVENGTWAETYDVLINTINTCTDPETRFALMHLAEDMVMQTGTAIPLYYYTQLYLLDDSVKGVYATPTGIYHFRKAVSDKTTLNISLSSDPWDLDPAANSAQDALTMMSQLFSGLARWDTDAQGNRIVVADCATELPKGVKNKDGSVTYTYTLRSGMRWSDGEPVTAYDFEYAWKRAYDSWADYSYLYEYIKGYGGEDSSEMAIKAKNASTLQVTLVQEVADWNELLTHPIFFPVRQDLVEHTAYWGQSAAGLVTNGPYKMVSWDYDNSLTMTKNTAHHDAANVTMKTLKFHFSDDADYMIRQFDSGAWQMVSCYPYGNLDQLQARYSKKLHTIGVTGTYFISFNVNTDLLK